MAYAAGWAPVEGRARTWRVWAGGWFSRVALDADPDGTMLGALAAVLDETIREHGWRPVGEPILQQVRQGTTRALTERGLEYWRMVGDAAEPAPT